MNAHIGLEDARNKLAAAQKSLASVVEGIQTLKTNHTSTMATLLARYQAAVARSGFLESEIVNGGKYTGAGVAESQVAEVRTEIATTQAAIANEIGSFNASLAALVAQDQQYRAQIGFAMQQIACWENA